MLIINNCKTLLSPLRAKKREFSFEGGVLQNIQSRTVNLLSERGL
jgi:hypothetical protein